MPPSDPRFFTEEWIITLPSHPKLKFTPMTPTPANFDSWVKICTNPLNHPFDNNKHEVWDEEKLKATKDRIRQRFIDAKTKHHVLELFVQLDGQSVGCGGVFELEHEPHIANIGLMVEESVRGSGVGKALMQVLLRLSNEFEVEIIEAGTMKVNKPMRALATSLGLKEKDEIKEVPGRGVVAEILYKDIAREKWKDLDMKVEFTGPVPED
jgi:RimJ/RimL family protein N-acetyltransferase